METPDQALDEPRRRLQPLCAAPPQQLPVLAPTLGDDRAEAIIRSASKWANGTVLHYYFFDQPGEGNDGSFVEMPDHARQWRTWVGAEAQQEVVRTAFIEWANLNIGLVFKEVPDREEAEIRIGFMDGDGSWSYVGTDIVEGERRDVSKRTMNFGWDLREAYGRSTALHEIGHTLGLPHEHMSPFAGIEWDSNAVYEQFSKAPNNWSRAKIEANILKQLDKRQVKGSQWDPDSIMEYEFGPGLIKAPNDPVNYWQDGLYPPGHISDADERWVLQFYPPLNAAAPPRLKATESVPLDLKDGEQADFTIDPNETRYYEIRTFGKSDTQLTLFEHENGEPRYRTSDDDSGEERNAALRIKLIRGHQYVLRVRLNYRETGPPPVVMMW